MKFKNLKCSALITAAAASAIYSAVAGKGIFNKPRFKEQHEALGKYVDANYPDCIYTPITMHGRGWASCVLRMGKTVSCIYFSKSDDGIYVFTESKQK